MILSFYLNLNFFYKKYKYISTNLQALHLYLSAWSTTLKMFAFKKIRIARDKGQLQLGSWTLVMERTFQLWSSAPVLDRNTENLFYFCFVLFLFLLFCFVLIFLFEFNKKHLEWKNHIYFLSKKKRKKESQILSKILLPYFTPLFWSLI